MSQSATEAQRLEHLQFGTPPVGRCAPHHESKNKSSALPRMLELDFSIHLIQQPMSSATPCPPPPHNRTYAEVLRRTQTRPNRGCWGIDVPKHNCIPFFSFRICLPEAKCLLSVVTCTFELGYVFMSRRLTRREINARKVEGTCKRAFSRVS